MSETNRRSPGAVIGIVTALVPVVGLYFTFLQNNRDDKKLDVDTEETIREQNRKDDEMRTRQRERHERIDRINERIGKIDNDIKHCRSEVGSANWKARRCLEKQ